MNEERRGEKVLPSGDGDDYDYHQLIHRIREVVRFVLPPHAVVVVVSRGDDELLRLEERPAWHFPQDEHGVYAGYLPTDSFEAIARLEALRCKGAQFLLLPRTEFWWLEHYAEFKGYLESQYRLVMRQDATCMIFQLRGDTDLPSVFRSLAENHEAYRDRCNRTVHPGDEMYLNAKLFGNPEAYFTIGHSAMACIAVAMALAGKCDVSTILDLPCGHGRVMRMLRARWPDARIVACDLLREGVDFCAKQFGAVPIYSNPNPDDIPINEQFDLIWVGSLLTHMDAPLWQPFLTFFADHLAPDGLLVFSTAGRYPTMNPRDGFSLLRDEYLANGFAYMDQTNPMCPWHSPRLQPGYGLAAASPAWVLDQLTQVPELRVLAFWERGWNDHQDVVVAVNRPVAAPRRPLVL
jgi:SAM-dependent methyltransferase